MEIDRKGFVASLGGATALNMMSDEAKADALEEHLMFQLSQATGNTKFPTAAEIEAQIETRTSRRGVGNLFVSPRGNVKKLPAMPDKPTLIDFFNLRFQDTANHVLQSANLAKKNGMSEEIILGCLLHDTVQALIRVDHG